MAFQDRRYDEGNDASDGGFRGALRRIFIRGDGFLSWSLPLFTVPRWIRPLAGIHVRVHLLYILIAASELISSFQQGHVGFAFAAAMMGTLFILVLLHEFGHCLACRLVGGEADDVLMWPLGGLAFCRPPMRWKPALITTLGGPAVNVIFVPILGLVLLATGAHWDELIFNPLRPQNVVNHVYFADAYWAKWLWAAYYMNFVLLAFNMLLPMYPMDGGRAMQEILWSRIGRKRSLQIAVNVGLVAALALGVVGAVYSETRMIAIAIFGGITCYAERQRLATMEDQPEWAFDTDKGYKGFADDPPPNAAADRKAAKALQKRQDQVQQTQAQVDLILDKIRDHGMQSLTAREKAILKEATQRTRDRT